MLTSYTLFCIAEQVNGQPHSLNGARSLLPFTTGALDHGSHTSPVGNWSVNIVNSICGPSHNVKLKKTCIVACCKYAAFLIGTHASPVHRRTASYLNKKPDGSAFELVGGRPKSVKK